MKEQKPIDATLRRLLDEQTAKSGNLAPMTNQERVQLVRSIFVQALESRTSIPGLPNQSDATLAQIAQ